MHDLRRQALESGKTVSRKAKAKVDRSSRTSSAANSRTNSRNVSRHGSDDDDGDNSDGTNLRLVQIPLESCITANKVSTWSLDDLLNEPEDESETYEEWKQKLNDRTEEIIDRKRSSVQGREAALESWVQILRSHFARDEIKGKASELLPAILRSIKAESSEKETFFALKGTSKTYCIFHKPYMEV